VSVNRLGGGNVGIAAVGVAIFQLRLVDNALLPAPLPV
jgi:hypothetical protein